MSNREALQVAANVVIQLVDLIAAAVPRRTPQPEAPTGLAAADMADLEARVLRDYAYELFDVYGGTHGIYTSLPAATGAATMKGLTAWAVYKHGTLVQYKESNDD